MAKTSKFDFLPVHGWTQARYCLLMTKTKRLFDGHTWWTSDTLGGQTFARQNAYKKDYKIEQTVNCKNQNSL